MAASQTSWVYPGSTYAGCARRTLRCNHNVNTWLADDPAKRYLVCTLRGSADQPGIARDALGEVQDHRQS